ncbi:thiolase family protein [Candidatus Cryosericum hinesii]|jgi:acetyl-CoA C-acetyltransferase|uniref:Thiolase family protein n=1 Tax=Candidatus Cryosericum hinesii TaxID=2290915 RepID=A0ABX9MGK1_9BACT|nr:thiolase family protein [Candidatus Cryosericum hinesii]RIE09846.1 thiolase family protein [Candidatus Cryosericum hinesii]RIE13714.1 thiolase family protein [Candidatus Cryosericum hinesii]
MKSVVITSAVRTPVGNMGGVFRDILAVELARTALEEAVKRSGIEKSIVDEIIVGQAKQSTDAPNIARVAALEGGFPEEVPAYTVHRQCSSGLQAILNAVWQIQAGYGDVIVAGGVESMSTAPYYLRSARYGYKSGNGELLDPNTESQPKSQPEDIYGTFTMGMTAENLADKYGITREEQDEFAYASHARAVAAIDAGRFKDEIVPVSVRVGKAGTVLVDTDEGPRRDTSLEKMAKLKAVFKTGGTVTAGNSSSRNDGAAAVVVMSEEKAVELGIKPLARFVAAGIAGVNPAIMGIGPVPATRKALERSGLSLGDIGLIELNEAFAAQSLAVVKELSFNRDILNVNGGAIALGHPLGCSGTRISVTLIHEMLRRNTRYGLATICVAGGLGVSTIFENLCV